MSQIPGSMSGRINGLENVGIAVDKPFVAHVTEEMSEGVFLAPNFILQ